MSQFDELPEGWELSKIGDLCLLINGKAFKPKDWSETGLKIVRIQNLNKPDAPFNHFSGEVDNKFYIDNGELLFAWSGTPGTSFGAHIWNRGKAILNQHIFRVIFDESSLDKIFFKYAINQKLQELIDKAHGGVGLRHVTKGKFEQTEIPLPPLNEQRRIVEKIEALTARSRKARRVLEAIPVLLDQFRQSVLAAAFRGDLTADWREQNPDIEPAEALLERIREASKSNPSKRKNKLKSIQDYSDSISATNSPKSWKLTQIDSICLSSFYGPRFSKDEYTSDGIPSIRTTDMKGFGKIEITDDTPRIRIPPDKLELYKVIKNDLLVTRSGSVGMMAIFKDDYLAIPSAYLIRFRFTPLISVEYIFLYLQSPIGQNLLGLSSTAVTQSNINAEAIKSLPIPLCSQAEQAEIVKLVNKWLHVIDWIQEQYQDVVSEMGQLDQSILAKAFRGELVPQDPDDEPATVLLDRIRAEREKLGKTRKSKRKAKT